MAPGKKRTSLVLAFDMVFGSPGHEGQALTTSISAAEGAAGSFPNNRMKHLICKTQGSLPAGVSTSPNTKTLVPSLAGHLAGVLRGQTATWEAVWTRGLLEPLQC